jgi:hypothetical protein
MTAELEDVTVRLVDADNSLAQIQISGTLKTFSGCFFIFPFFIFLRRLLQVY